MPSGGSRSPFAFPFWMLLLALVSLALALGGCGTPTPDSQATADTVVQNAYQTATAVHLAAQANASTSPGSPVTPPPATRGSVSPATTPTTIRPPITPTATTIPIAGGGPQGFLGDGTSADPSLVFIQWTEANGNLTGQLQVSVLQLGGTVLSDSIGFTGLRSGTSVNLQLVGTGSILTLAGYGSSPNLAGTLSGTTLTLLILDPQTRQYRQAVLRAASVQDYNKAMQTLGQKVAATATALGASLMGVWEVAKDSRGRVEFRGDYGDKLEFASNGEFKYSYSALCPPLQSPPCLSQGRGTYTLGSGYLTFNANQATTFYAYTITGNTMRLERLALPGIDTPTGAYPIIYTKVR